MIDQLARQTGGTFELLERFQIVYQRFKHEAGALKFDDRVDALAMLVAHFVEVMDQDQKSVEQNAYQDWLTEEVERLHDFNMRETDDRKTFHSGWGGNVA